MAHAFFQSVLRFELGTSVEQLTRAEKPTQFGLSGLTGVGCVYDIAHFVLSEIASNGTFFCLGGIGWANEIPHLLDDALSLQGQRHDR